MCSMLLPFSIGKAFNTQSLINNAVSNIICCLVFGERFEYTNKKFQLILQDFYNIEQMQGKFSVQVRLLMALVNVEIYWRSSKLSDFFCYSPFLSSLTKLCARFSTHFRRWCAGCRERIRKFSMEFKISLTSSMPRFMNIKRISTRLHRATTLTASWQRWERYFLFTDWLSSAFDFS